MIERARASLRAYHDEHDPELAQLAYADHDDASEDIEIALHTMCTSYASTLAPGQARRYLRAFDRQARDAYRDVAPHLNLYGRQDYE